MVLWTFVLSKPLSLACMVCFKELAGHCQLRCSVLRKDLCKYDEVEWATTLLRNYGYLIETTRVELHFGHLMIFPSCMKSPFIWRNKWPHFRHLYVMFMSSPPALLHHIPLPYCNRHRQTSRRVSEPPSFLLQG